MRQGEKTWVESSEDINVLPLDIELEPGEYVVGGNIANPHRIRKKTELGDMKPADIKQEGKSYWVTAWEKV